MEQMTALLSRLQYNLSSQFFSKLMQLNVLYKLHITIN